MYARADVMRCGRDVWVWGGVSAQSADILRVRERVNVLGEAAQADHYPRELADVADAREVRLCHVAG